MKEAVATCKLRSMLAKYKLLWLQLVKWILYKKHLILIIATHNCMQMFIRFFFFSLQLIVVVDVSVRQLIFTMHHCLATNNDESKLLRVVYSAD